MLYIVDRQWQSNIVIIINHQQVFHIMLRILINFLISFLKSKIKISIYIDIPTFL